MYVYILCECHDEARIRIGDMKLVVMMSEAQDGSRGVIALAEYPTL